MSSFLISFPLRRCLLCLWDIPLQRVLLHVFEYDPYVVLTKTPRSGASDRAARANAQD